MQDESKQNPEYRKVPRVPERVRPEGTSPSLPGDAPEESAEVRHRRIIRARRRVDKDLRSSIETYRMLFKASPLGILLLDTNGQFLECNERFSRMLSAPNEAYSGINLHNFLDEPQLQAAMAKALRGGPGRFEAEYVFAVIGRKIIVKGELMPLRAPDGTISGIMGFFEDITERTSKEEALRRSADMYRVLMENMKDVVWVINPDTMHFSYISPSVKQLRGYSPEEVMTAPLEAAYMPKDRGYLKARIKQRVADLLAGRAGTDTYYINEIEHPCKNGSTVWVEEITFYSISKETGKAEVRGVSRDITERKRGEVALRASKERFRILVDSMDDFVYTLDRRQRYTGVYGTWLKKKGLVPETFLGRKAGAVLGERNAAIHEEAYERALAGTVVTYEWSSSGEGGRLHYQTVLSPIRDADGSVSGLVGIARDITERKHAERQLQASLKSLQAVVDNVEAIVYVADLQTHEILLLNSYARNIFGDVIGQTCWNVLQKDQGGPCSFCTDAGAVDAEGRLSDTHVRECQSSVNGRWYECRDKAIQWPDGRIVRMEIAADISDRKSQEQEMIRTHKLESVSILAGGIAHDFNNLLQGILGNISIAKMYAQKGGGKIYDALVSAEGIVSTAKELSYRLLTFSEGGSPLKQVTTVQEMDMLLRKCVSQVLKGSSIVYDFNIASDLHPVEIDEGQMDQVFRNLAINAKESMVRGGTVRVIARNVTVSAQDNLPLKEGGYVRISVQDQGAGIPAANLAKIFDPYFTTKEMGSHKGLGLGLAVCYSVVKKHSGSISVESRVGVGSTFHVYLPVFRNDRYVTGTPRSYSPLT